MKLDSLQKLYLDQLKDMHNAESQLIATLPKMRDAATSPELRRAFADHLEQTKGHKRRLEQIFDQYDNSPRSQKCPAMEGLVKEGDELAGADEPVRDAALICAAQKVEHYEIGTYGTLREYARILGDDTGVELLSRTLEEEKDADKLLTRLAEESINALAMAREA